MSINLNGVDVDINDINGFSVLYPQRDLELVLSDRTVKVPRGREANRIYKLLTEREDDE